MNILAIRWGRNPRQPSRNQGSGRGGSCNARRFRTQQASMGSVQAGFSWPQEGVPRRAAGTPRPTR